MVFGRMSIVRSTDPLLWTWKWNGIISSPFATTFSFADVPSVNNALAPVIFRISLVTFPAGAFVAPRRSAEPRSFVMSTFIPVEEGTWKTNWSRGAVVVTFPWYLRVKLVTFRLTELRLGLAP